jgi:hypothetical protein
MNTDDWEARFDGIAQVMRQGAVDGVHSIDAQELKSAGI